jgi:NAD-dependent DNA ligase
MKQHFQSLIARIAAANAAYHTKDAPIMTDAEYDALRREADAILKEHPEYGEAADVLEEVGAKPATLLIPKNSRNSAPASAASSASMKPPSLSSPNQKSTACQSP